MALCYIIGHKNPDTDSICSAIAYADFKHKIGEPNFVAARCGNTNARIDAVLNRFGVPAPVFVGDVTPRLKDVMVTRVHKTRPTHTCAEALDILEKFDIRVLPVVDVGNRLMGQVSIFRLGDFFVPKRINGGKELRRVYTTLSAISHALQAKVHHWVNADSPEELYIRVGAVSCERFEEVSKSEDIPMAKSILVVGDRWDLINIAITAGVRLIVLTMGTLPSPELLAAAKARGVSVLSSEYDSANTSWIIRSANRLEEIIEDNVTSFSEEEKVVAIRKRLANDRRNIFFVADEQKQLRGVFAKGDLYKSSNMNLILVDHNEVSQAVDGAAEVEILEIIDHHRLGNLPTQKPIKFINDPVGSTCTIIADMYRREGLVPSAAMSGLMMSGIITDTLNLQSPTATLKDATLLSWLSTIAAVPIAELAADIFSQGSVLLTTSPEQAIGIDQKTFHEGDHKFIIAQVEEVGFDQFWVHYEELLAAIQALRTQQGASLAGLIVTDVTKQVSLFVVDAAPDVVAKMTVPTVKPHVYDIGPFVSRKKQVVPYVSEILRQV